MADWTITYAGIEKPLANWGINTAPTRTRANMAADVCTISVPGPMDATPLFAYGAAGIVRRDRVLSGGSYSGGSIWFSGRFNNPRSVGSGREERVNYQLKGPWFDLERCVFQAQWSITADGTTYTDTPCSDVFLGRNVYGAWRNAGQQCADIIAWAVSCGANLQAGTIDPTLVLWPYEIRDVMCAEAINQTLRLVPDAVCYFDYTTSPPTLNIRQLANLTNVAVPPSGSFTKAVDLTPRNDLVVPSVAIHYKSTAIINGQPFVSLATDLAPGGATGTELGALVATVDLYGQQVTTVHGAITTAPCNALSSTPADVVAWWKMHEPLFSSAKIDPSSLVITPGTITDETGATVSLGTYPNELTDGQVAAWMQMSGGVNVISAKATVKAIATYDLYADSARKVLLQKGKTKELATRVKLTNGTSNSYWALQSVTASELAPVGVAAAVLASLSTLQYEGRIDLVGSEIPYNLGPGNRITLTAGALTLTNQIVQQVTEEPHLGRMSLTIGPARHLGIADIIAYLRHGRVRSTTTYPATQVSGQNNSGGDVQLGGELAKENTTSGLGSAGAHAASDDKGTGGSGPNGMTVGMIDAVNEQWRLNRIDPTASTPNTRLTTDGSGHAVPQIKIALADCNGKDVQLRDPNGDGSRVLCTSDFTSGGGTDPYLFTAFVTPNGSPDGSSCVLIKGVPWTEGWTVGAHPPSGITPVYIALPHKLRSNLGSEALPGLLGPGTAGTVTYSGYTFTSFSSAGHTYWNQHRTATAPAGSGLPNDTQWITPPYLADDVLRVESGATAINVQIASGDPVTAVGIASGGTGYVSGDVGTVLTVVGGSGTAATLTITAVAAGAVTGIAVTAAGAYTTPPTNAVAVTGSTTGTGATFNLIFTLITLMDANYDRRGWAET